MQRKTGLIAGFIASFALAAIAGAESKVTLDNVHICCASCIKVIQKTVPSNVAVNIEKKDGPTKSLTLTAPDAESAQKAVDALVAAGFYGKATGADIKDADVPSGKVKSATVTGLHNCCKKCAKAVNETVKSVPGASGEIQPKEETMTVTGDFDAAELAKAFKNAGLNAKIETK